MLQAQVDAVAPVLPELDGGRLHGLLADLLDGIGTSYDVGHRKPHPAMFERAIELAGCAPDACVMIGNSERSDVEPALALGMMVIRVALQEPPTPTRARHLVTDLGAAVERLRGELLTNP